MKVLWITNYIPSFINNSLNDNDGTNGHGWLDYIGEMMCTSGNSFYVTAPASLNEVEYHINGLTFFPFSRGRTLNGDIGFLKKFFVELFTKCSPDIIHIHGTEFPHSFAAMLALDELGLCSRAIISIQGLVSVYYDHYYAGLEDCITKRHTFRDLIRGNIRHDAKIYKKRGYYEKKAIQMTSNVIGRTEWDRACVYTINKNAKYFHCNETLRSSFYTGQWDLSNCEKHSVFVSQSSYPIKGFHKAINAIGLLKKDYPDIKLYVTGKNPNDIPWYRIDTYHRYLLDLIKKHNLVDNVFFLGALNEDDMKKRFLKSNVFLMCSSIENSPNSLGEAMILGVPCIASYVGGIPDLFNDKIDGFLYAFDEEYMIAHYVSEIFENYNEIKDMLKNERVHALETHNPNINFNKLLDIYNQVNEDRCYK